MRRFVVGFILLVLIYSTQIITAQTELPTCDEGSIQHALELVGEYQPTEMAGFVQLDEQGFVIEGESYVVRGINYYPSNFPWRRFFVETDTETLHRDFALLSETGFNSLRIFLWNTALFQCPGSGAVPNAFHLLKLDEVIQVASEYDLRLIVTLNDLPDLQNYPLYDNPLHVQQQTQFIIERYRDEPAILAWDLRNEGDIDYGSQNGFVSGDFTREHVLNWLGETSELVRSLDSNHLITAGWLFDNHMTAPYVDFISFHHWTWAEELQGRIDEIRSHTDKPILLQEFGYSTADPNITLESQAEIISDVIAWSETNGLAGWMIWTAFDFPREATCYPSPCQSEDNFQHYFGIWTVDYTEKPAVPAIRETLAVVETMDTFSIETEFSLMRFIQSAQSLLFLFVVMSPSFSLLMVRRLRERSNQIIVGGIILLLVNALAIGGYLYFRQRIPLSQWGEWGFLAIVLISAMLISWLVGRLIVWWVNREK